MGLLVKVESTRSPDGSHFVMRTDDERESAPSWERYSGDDLGSLSRYLLPGEAAILELARLGKTPVEVARVLGLPSRQLADREVWRVGEVARFYAERAGLMERVKEVSRSFSVERAELIRLFVFERLLLREVAERLGIQRKEARRRLRLLLDHLRRDGYPDVAGLLEETWSNRKLRARHWERDAKMLGWRGGRRAMVAEAWRFDLRDLLLTYVGKIDYDWGGQRVDWAAGYGHADCSGLVIEMLKKVGRLPATFRDVNAQGLWGFFSKRTRQPQLCDLAFYGKDPQRIQHVMFYLGRGQIPEGRASVWLREKECVIGMCNGAEDMEACDAHLLGAGLFVRTTPRYRGDFLGYGVVR